jgi:hypothetical protein
VRDMAIHVKVLGAIYIAVALLGLLCAALVLLGLGGAAGIVGTAADPEDAAVSVPILAGLGTLLAGVILLLSLPGLLAGMGLLSFKPWARIVGIVLAAIYLLGFPLLTLVGVYGLWVLLSKDSERLFESTSRAMTPAQ